MTWTAPVRLAPRALAAIVLTLSLTACAAATSPFPSLTRDPLDLTEETFRVGVAYDQHSADSWGDVDAVSDARQLLIDEVPLQAQSLMGWGANNPEPAPGEYDWDSLDARMDLIRSTGGTAILTLCGAPDWMKGGTEGTTDWSLLEVAPTPEHYDDFAALSVEVLKRYPYVRYVLVWNELKGFYDATANTWDAAAYTTLYNTVYAAIKEYDPQIAVGGPYAPMDSWSDPSVASHPSTVAGPWGVVDRRSLDAVEYWLAHADGADFVVVDGGTGTKDAGRIVDGTTAAQKFAAINTWLAARTELPIWWAEAHLAPGDEATTPQDLDAAFQALADSGARVALLWNPQHTDGADEPWLWTDTADEGGGQPGPYQEVWRSWAQDGGA